MDYASQADAWRDAGECRASDEAEAVAALIDAHPEQYGLGSADVAHEMVRERGFEAGLSKWLAKADAASHADLGKINQQIGAWLVQRAKDAQTAYALNDLKVAA